MNVLGHAYVASQVIGHLNPLVAAGSQLPDIVPFADQKIFTFQEIHEGCGDLLRFVQRNYPQKIDLPLAMMTHSVKYGADKFNQKIVEWLLANQPKLRKTIAQEIVKCSGIDYQTAFKGRLHNYLWVGMDIYLLKNYPDFAKDFHRNLLKVDLNSIAEVLAEGYDKEANKVEKVVDQYLKVYYLEELKSTNDLALILKRKTTQLPEGDDVQLARAIKLGQDIYQQFKSKYPQILAKVLKSVRKRMSKFL